MAKPYERCYPGGENKGAMILGYALVLAGVILLFCCIPCWGLAGASGRRADGAGRSPAQNQPGMEVKAWL
ncbi:MAG: hypothetical protein ACLUE8_05410 [Lachnospiraceae bacterium]